SISECLDNSVSTHANNNESFPPDIPTATRSPGSINPKSKIACRTNFSTGLLTPISTLESTPAFTTSFIRPLSSTANHHTTQLRAATSIFLYPASPPRTLINTPPHTFPPLLPRFSRAQNTPGTPNTPSAY